MATNDDERNDLMTLSRDELSKGLVAELEDFERLVRTLTPQDVATPSRCEGWTVGDVAAHVIGTMTDITEGRLEGQGTAEVTAQQVEERRGRSGEELADELRRAIDIAPGLLGSFDDAAWAAPLAGFDFSLGEGVETLWYDAYVHADDIRAAIGQPSVRGDGLRASVFHVRNLLTRKGWGPATLQLDGIGEVKVGDGRGVKVAADPFDFVLVATGRRDPATLGLDPAVNVYG